MIVASGWALNCVPMLVRIFSATFVPISRPLLEQEGNVSNSKDCEKMINDVAFHYFDLMYNQKVKKRIELE